ncbi:MAG: Uncharacterized protein G01um10145_677 [Microgenomates group bacterium Gr01-1014_5]|nr:MAG: Uncharacterized protein G01um10145_677 [Microgenomates group bacterium Gr01-1014_5]
MLASLKFLLPIFVLVLFFYYKILGVYFSQDDFFHITISQTDGTVRGFLGLFGFYPFEERGIAFYRPVFREAFFNIFYSIFGLNQLPYRVFQLALHFTNIVLVYTFTQKWLGDKRISGFAALLFGISAANVATLYYLTGGVQVLGATVFILLTLLFYEKHTRWAFLTFLVVLASHELAVVVPLLLIVMNWRRALPFVVLTFIYLYLEFTIIGFSKEEVQYQAVISLPKLINTYAWYTGWALGLPEMLIDFVRSGLKLNPSLMRYWGDYYKIIFSAFFVALFGLLYATSSLFFKKRQILLNKKVFLLIIWFVAGLLPVAVLPWHKSTYYLYPVLAAFSILVSYLVFKFAENTKNLPARVMVAFLVAALFILNTTSVTLGDSTYWAATRGRLAEKLIGQISAQYPTLPKGAVFYIKNDPNYPFVAKDWGGTSKQASIILNREDALRLYYQDPTITVYYEDMGNPPDTSTRFEITAKLN